MNLEEDFFSDQESRHLDYTSEIIPSKLGYLL